MDTNKKTNFVWRNLVMYGSPYEDGKQAFIDDLHKVMTDWQGPTMIGGDFNLSRFTYDKSSGHINCKWADFFNDWVNKWALMDLSASNRGFT